MTKHSPLTEIGPMLGKRDHTTVMHGTEKVERELHADPALRQDSADLGARRRSGVVGRSGEWPCFSRGRPHGWPWAGAACRRNPCTVLLAVP
jgi:hypothetical protein